jgi:hypothetical protein
VARPAGQVDIVSWDRARAISPRPAGFIGRHATFGIRGRP